MCIHPLLAILLKGMAIGILLSAPMGPTGVLCIRRTLHSGRAAGIYTGLGAMFSDLFYASLTYLGVGFVIDFIQQNELLFQLIGSVLMLVFGAFLYMHPPRYHQTSNQSDSLGVAKTISTSFLLTLGNPLIIFFLLALYSRFNVSELWINIPLSYAMTLISIAIGAMLWWTGVTYLLTRLRSRATVASLNAFNRIVAVVFVVLAIIGFITAGIEAYDVFLS